MNKKPHINSILKKGAKMGASKIKITKEVLDLIEKTIEAQKNIPKSYRFPYH